MKQTAEELTAEAFEQGRVFGGCKMKENIIKLILEWENTHFASTDERVRAMQILKAKLERMQ